MEDDWTVRQVLKLVPGSKQQKTRTTEIKVDPNHIK